MWMKKKKKWILINLPVMGWYLYMIKNIYIYIWILFESIFYKWAYYNSGPRIMRVNFFFFFCELAVNRVYINVVENQNTVRRGTVMISHAIYRNRRFTGNPEIKEFIIKFTFTTNYSKKIWTENDKSLWSVEGVCHIK